jgi:hypothetical protein
MLKEFSRARLVGAWCAAVVVIGACSVVLGAPITIGNLGLLLVACVVPPTVLLLVWRGAPPLTVAELLHDVNTPSKDPRQ